MFKVILLFLIFINFEKRCIVLLCDFNRSHNTCFNSYLKTVYYLLNLANTCSFRKKTNFFGIILDIFF